jgi:epoxyqueuosine reductase
MTAPIVDRARELGATLAGIASVDSLRGAPSYRATGTSAWPEGTSSLLVLALAHPADEPRLDWWDDKPWGTPGNRRLQRVAEGLQSWLKREFNAEARPLPYQLAHGGVFLKDAAVLAGLGVIGRNNLLVTPAFGPRVRLRALSLDLPLEPTGPASFAPCSACETPCQSACPQAAFRNGSYDVTLCRVQMGIDEALAGSRVAHNGLPQIQAIRYCRACELACPVAVS